MVTANPQQLLYARENLTLSTHVPHQSLSQQKLLLTLDDFSEGGDGGAPSECDEKYHAKTERVVALSTG
ncbi:conserved hypothetical protein [Ricinus communis]|uniref:Uncharacterized protein n=1 Tax=Ricinus communis TaxID=3988 RepID=B9STW0_RICCO|nr:conserved hypothetical protein [Ricinus communis]